MSYSYQNLHQQSAYGAPNDAQQSQYAPVDASVVQQDPNAHYQTPPGYVLVPISQIGAVQAPVPPPASQYGAPSTPIPAPSQPLQPSHAAQSAQLQNQPSPYGLPTQATPSQPSAPSSGQHPHQPPVQSTLGPPGPQLPPRPTSPVVAPLPATQYSSAQTFPTSTPYTLIGHRISETKELFVLPSQPLDSPNGYEAQYRPLDYTNRKDWHTTVFVREPSVSGGDSQSRLAGNCMYHRYWSNRIQMMMPYLKEPYEFEDAWVSDVGVCEGRTLQWSRIDAADLNKHASPETGKPPVFVLECAETNRNLVLRVIMDTMRNCRIQVWVAMENQKQLDEQIVMSICMMHRMRFKVKKDEKAWLKDEDWDKLGNFTKVANGAMGVTGA